MSVFQIDEEIDKLVDRFAEQLKDRLQKAVVRSEKLVLKQYIASQKETTTKSVKEQHGSRNTLSNTDKRKEYTSRRIPRREQDYAYASSSDSN